MGYLRIRLVHRDTREPVSASGLTPYVLPHEIDHANQHLEQRQLPWVWVPTTDDLPPCG